MTSTTAVSSLSATEILRDLLSVIVSNFPDLSPRLAEKYVSVSENTPESSSTASKDSKTGKSGDKLKAKYSSDDEKLQKLFLFGTQTWETLEISQEQARSVIRMKSEEKFQITIRDVDYFSSNSTTMLAIAKMIQNRGKMPYTPILVHGSDLLKEAIRLEGGYDNENMFIKSYYTLKNLLLGKGKKKINSSLVISSSPSEILPSAWFERHQVQASANSLTFPKDIGLSDVTMSKKEINDFVYYCIQVFGVFFYIPIVFYLLFKFFSWTTIITVSSIFVFYVYFPDYSEFPPLFRRHEGFLMNVKYFSYKTIVEAPSSAYANVPSIYTFGPHGIFGIAPTIQALINSYLVGEHFHVLAASAVFLFPLYNMLLKMMSFEDISKKSFLRLLEKGHSVGIIPGGIGEMFYSGNAIKMK
jgi:hypothetical protein